jgi:hypothetical protein
LSKETHGRGSICCIYMLRYVSIRQHTSAYVSIRQHTSAPRCSDTLEPRERHYILHIYVRKRHVMYIIYIFGCTWTKARSKRTRTLRPHTPGA